MSNDGACVPDLDRVVIVATIVAKDGLLCGVGGGAVFFDGDRPSSGE